MRKVVFYVGVVGAILATSCSSSKQAAPTIHPTPTTSTVASTTTALSASMDPSSLLSRARQAALDQGWAHLAVQFATAGHNATFDQDSGPDTGRQIVTVDNQHATVVLVGGIAYIKGDAAAVTGFFGFPASEQAQLADKWIAIDSTAARYADTTSGVTLSSALNELSLGPPLSTTAPTTVNCQMVVGVTGALTPADNSGTGTGTLYINIASALPVRFTATATGGPNGSGTETVDFSAWGNAVALTAPAPTIADSSLSAP